MITYFIICGVCLIIGIIIGTVSEKPIETFAGGILTGVALLGIFVGIVSMGSTEKSLSDYSVKTEIRGTYVNGQVTESDTVYIFTPKKK